jgi:uncharacterized protein (DUF305 family)
MHNPYRRLLVMALSSFLSMYVLMYAMVDRASNALPNLNQAYMAGLMTAPMVLIEVLIMSGMYPERRRNGIVLAVSLIVGIGCFAAMRRQTAISEGQFLRSMIPHHAGAILMCDNAALQSDEAKQLCRNITSSQRSEIRQMKRMLSQ